MSELSLRKKSSKVKSSSDNFNDYQDYDYEYDDYEEELNHPITDENINFISESDIISEREKMILEATEKLFLERNQAILAMIYYKWNIDNLDNWYEDVEQNKINAGIELSPQKKEEFKKNGIESFGDNCLVCFEEKNDDFYCLNCGHQFCADCWKDYLIEKLKSPLGALQVKCLQEGCTCIVPEQIFKKFVQDKVLIEKLDKAISKNFINRNEDLKQCPNPHCHLYSKSNMHSAREIKCKCGTSYCFKCSKESHRPCTCEMFEKWNNLNSNSKNDEKWIMANTKECPHCHQKIEKSQGCNYMYCDPKAGGCGHAFCYVCETDWAKHSQDHFNCNKYTEAVKNKENNAKKIKAQLKRYDFYFSRFIDNEKAVDIVDKKLREEIGEKLNILVTLKNLTIMETQFIVEALETVINGKRLLKNTYIFGYFMKDNNKKDYFEHEQCIFKITKIIREICEIVFFDNVTQFIIY